MPKFITTDRVGVTDDAGNTVWVRRKMNMGSVLRIQEAGQKGESLITLYIQNILGWDGPDFRGVPCTPERIETIDYEDPFWVQVGDKIAELNPRLQGGATEDSPLPGTTDGATSTVESPPARTSKRISTSS